MFDTQHLHPMIVHFPIALLIIGFLFDLIGSIFKRGFFSKTSFYLLILGTLGVVAAYISGNLAGEGITEVGSLKQALETHEGAAELTLWIMVAASLLRISSVMIKNYTKILRWIALTVFFIGVLSVARTGYYGGQLVYKHAAGVQFNLNTDFNTQSINSEGD